MGIYPQVDRYTVGLRPMDWSAVMDMVEANGEWAIVRDLSQAGPLRGVMGDYWDVYSAGRLRGCYDSLEEAESAMRDFIAEHLARG